MKYAISTKVPARTKAKLKAAATEHMQALEQSPERIKMYFRVHVKLSDRDSRIKLAGSIMASSLVLARP
ncbi:MAG: hypothetical protein IPP36_07990 [Nitrosomonadales bacterium]|nr:hypothetical protein [Nitrosomonadales bacterium]